MAICITYLVLKENCKYLLGKKIHTRNYCQKKPNKSAALWEDPPNCFYLCSLNLLHERTFFEALSSRELWNPSDLFMFFSRKLSKEEPSCSLHSIRRKFKWFHEYGIALCFLECMSLLQVTQVENIIGYLKDFKLSASHSSSRGHSAKDDLFILH